MAWKPSALRMPLGAGLLLLGAMTFVGCGETQKTTAGTNTVPRTEYDSLQGKYDNLAAENRGLVKENRDLSSELSLLKESADGSALGKAQLQTELNETKAELKKTRQELADALDRPATTTVTKVERVTGFDGIAGAEVDATQNEIAVRVSSDVLFAPGKAILRSTAKKTLDQIAMVLKKQYGQNQIRIEGYTDSTPIKRSGWKDNLELSAMRAMSVQRYLESKGVNSKLFSAAFGKQDPVADNNSPAGRAKNRRVEIVVLR